MSVRAHVLACLIALAAASGVARADFVVIRNAKNPTAKLSADQVKQTFLGKTKTWPGGEPVILVIGSEDSPAMKWLAESVYHVATKLLLSKLKQEYFKGDVPRPLVADDDAKTIKRVQSGAGVIGLVSPAAVKSLPADVAIVAVDGLR